MVNKDEYITARRHGSSVYAVVVCLSVRHKLAL